MKDLKADPEQEIYFPNFFDWPITSTALRSIQHEVNTNISLSKL